MSLPDTAFPVYFDTAFFMIGTGRKERHSLAHWIPRRASPKGFVMTNEYYPHERRILRALLDHNFHPRVVYDIGASTGIWSEVVSSVLPSAEYHLFEPLAAIAEEYRKDLRNRLARLPNLILHPVALGEANGKADFYIDHNPYCSSMNDRGDIVEIREKIQVDRYLLRDYRKIEDLPLPDIIKIDCQGAEDAIIRGGLDEVRHAKVLFLETWLKRGYGPRTPLLGEIIELLKPLGFSLVEFGEKFFDEKHRLYSIDAFFFSESLLETVWLPLEN